MGQPGRRELVRRREGGKIKVIGRLFESPVSSKGDRLA